MNLDEQRKKLLERDLNLRPLDWRAGALPTELSSPTMSHSSQFFFVQNRETANVGLDSSGLVEPRHFNPEVAGSSSALVNFSLFIQIYLKSVPSQFPLWFITWCVYKWSEFDMKLV